MISNLFDKNIIRILSYFLISPGSRYTRKEIKEKTQMNNIPLDSTLTKLKSLRLITSKGKLYSLNFSIEKKKETDKIKKEINKLNIKIELHFFEEKDLKANDPLIKEILKNGKPIL